METSLSGLPRRFRRKVLSVVGFIPNAPTHRRDTVVCELDCGHTRSVLCINRGEATVAEQSQRLIGSVLDCAKCAVVERIRQKARLRPANRARPARRIHLHPGSTAAS
jgi:hypothetical protein